MRRAPQLHVAGVAVAQRGVDGRCAGSRADALEAARRARARRDEREADAADLPPLGPDRRGPGVRRPRRAARAAASSRRRGAARAPCRGRCRRRASGGRPAASPSPVSRSAAVVTVRRPPPPAGARPQNATSSCAGRVDDGVVRRHLGALDGHDRARRRSGRASTSANGCSTIRLARPTECGLAVGVAREPGHERAVAQHERARLARRPTPRSRAARPRGRGRRGRASCPAPSRGCSWSRALRAAGARGWRERSVSTRSAASGAGRRRRDRRRRGVAAAVDDLHRAAAGDRRERGPERARRPRRARRCRIGSSDAARS